MLTMPRYLGYSFNPLTTYYVYDPDLIAVVLEVHNTFGEKHIYVVRDISQSISRRFHVSPFNDRLGTYQFKSKDARKGISIELTLVAPEGKPKLVATLRSRSYSPVGDIPAVLRLCVQCGWWIFMSFPRILYEAWKLHYRKGLPVYMRPEPYHEKGTIGRRPPGSVDIYFKKLVLEHLQHPITFKILSKSTISPEIVEINPPSKQTVTILSDAFFTNLACKQPLAGLADDTIDFDLDACTKEFNLWKRMGYRYMKIRAMMNMWLERELFQRIATFHSKVESNA
jgi:hypothetical protein